MTFNDVGLSDDGFVCPNTTEHIISDNIKFENGEPFTFECLVQWIGNDSPSFYVLPFGNVYDVKSTLYFYDPNSNKMRFRSDTNVNITIPNSHPLDVGLFDGSQHHVVYVIESNGDISVYIDAVQNGDTVNINDTSFIFNGYGDGYGADTYVWQGYIKYVSIYNRTLTAQEVADRYNQSTFLFLNNTPTPTQQAYLDWQDSRIIGRSR
jgi:hypothetical protein